MKVRVDEETCVGDETWVEMCPEIFEMKGDVAVAKIETVPKDLEAKCKEAVEIGRAHVLNSSHTT
jgi:ferredoxin